MGLEHVATPNLDYQRNVIWIDIRLGELYSDMGKPEEAVERLKKAVDEARQSHGADTIEYVAALNQLGKVLIQWSNFESARKVLDEAREHADVNHPLYSMTHSYIGLLHLVTGEPKEAAQVFDQVLQHELQRMQEVLPFLSEAEALNYVAANARLRDNLLSALKATKSPNGLMRGYNALWRTRSLATRSVIASRRWIHENEESKELAAELAGVRASLTNLTWYSHTARKDQNVAAQLSKLTEKKESLEKRLGRLKNDQIQSHSTQRHFQDGQPPNLSSGGVGESQESTGADRLADRSDSQKAEEVPSEYAEILSLVRALPLDVALVEFIEFSTSLFGRSISQETNEDEHCEYIAFVIRRTNAEGHYTLGWIDLGPSGPINSAIKSYRNEIIQSSSNAVRSDSSTGGVRLRELVWDKIAPSLGPCKTILIVPDQDLAQVPWLAIPDVEPGSYLIDKYAIGILPFGQRLAELLRLPVADTTPDEKPRMLLLGGIDYDTSAIADTTKLESQITSLTQREGATVGNRVRWKSLPGTEEELGRVRELFGSDQQATVLSGRTANKTRLRSELPNNRYVHLATHGSFLVSSLDSVVPATRSPLLHSGLVLAGREHARDHRIRGGRRDPNGRGDCRSESVRDRPGRSFRL